MGILASKDTRRISFYNTFALNPPITVQKSIEDRDVINLDDLSPEPSSELFYQEIKKPVNLHKDGETDYWAQRIDSLKKKHQIINKIIETEYDKKIESTNNTFQQPTVVTHERIQKIKPCFDWRVKIVKCYEDNPHQPLVCSPVVQAFSKCVASCRMEE